MKHITLLFLAMSLSFTAVSQTTITGVISNNVETLPGANIMIKGTQKGTSTNMDGFFELKAMPNDTLSISYLGYKTEAVIVAKQKTINITLDVDNTLDEVVVIAHSSYVTCKRTILCCISSCCGITSEKIITENPSEIKQAILYPNPSSTGYFNLKLLEKYSSIRVQVSHISGRLVQTRTIQNIQGEVNLDLSRYASGIYIISIVADGKRLTAKKAIIG